MVTYATINDSRDCLEGQHEGQQIPGGGTPLEKPNRYVPPQRVGFLGLFGLKTCIHFAHFGLELGMVFEETTGAYERTYYFNST